MYLSLNPVYFFHVFYGFSCEIKLFDKKLLYWWSVTYPAVGLEKISSKLINRKNQLTKNFRDLFGEDFDAIRF